MRVKPRQLIRTDIACNASVVNPDSATLEVGDYSSSDAQDVSRRFTKVLVPRPGFPSRCRSIKHFATPSISNTDLSLLVSRNTTDDRSNIFDVDLNPNSRTRQIDRPRPDKYAIIMYMTTIPIATARANLSQLVEEASTTHERVEITKNGQRAAVLLGADDYDSIMETIAVLSDGELLLAHLRGLEEVGLGDVVDAGGLVTLLNETGRTRGSG